MLSCFVFVCGLRILALVTSLTFFGFGCLQYILFGFLFRRFNIVRKVGCFVLQQLSVMYESFWVSIHSDELIS
jgi:hypothetical protein